MPAQKEQKPYTKREREGNGPGGKLEAVITIGSFEMTYELVPTCTHIVKNDKKKSTHLTLKISQIIQASNVLLLINH